MSSRTNLNDNVETTFPFTVGGLDYDLKYPTLEEIEPVTEITRQRDIEAKKNTPESVEKVAELEKELEEIFYGFILPVGHTTPIRDTLKTQPFPVVKAFSIIVYILRLLQ